MKITKCICNILIGFTILTGLSGCANLMGNQYKSAPADSVGSLVCVECNGTGIAEKCNLCSGLGSISTGEYIYYDYSMHSKTKTCPDCGGSGRYVKTKEHDKSTCPECNTPNRYMTKHMYEIDSPPKEPYKITCSVCKGTGRVWPIGGRRYDENVYVNNIQAQPSSSASKDNTVAQPKTIEERIKELNELKKSGLISDIEYQEKKKSIIDEL